MPAAESPFTYEDTYGIQCTSPFPLTFAIVSGYCQDEYGDVTAYFSTKADVRHIWGVQYVMPTWPMGEEFFWQCKKVGPSLTYWLHCQQCVECPIFRLLMVSCSSFKASTHVVWCLLQGVLSYVILRPLMTLVATLAMLLGTYNDGSLSYDSLYTYVSIINATSQMWALYCLVLMYQVRCRVAAVMVTMLTHCGCAAVCVLASTLHAATQQLHRSC